MSLPAAGSLAPLAPLASADRGDAVPNYRVVSSYAPWKQPGMPGPYPGQVVSLKSDTCINEKTDQVNVPVIAEMIAKGMCALTGEKNAADAWRRFFVPQDVVGIKLNCSGAPQMCSSPEVVAEVVKNLMAVGLKPGQIYLYERFKNQVDTVHYDRYVPPGVQIVTAEQRRGGILGYDPSTYVEVDFFGEEDTRSNVFKHVTQTFTKIINIPNMKDHGASGVTGCLKNIAYGSYSNVARSHEKGKSNTLTFIGTLASAEPVRSKTVLQIMDGMRGVWHGGPFLVRPQYKFFPKQMMIGTDPVAIDRLLLDIIEAKRKAEGAISVWDRSEKNLRIFNGEERNKNPNINILIREPGHIEFASKKGLGVHDISKIKVTEIRV